MSPEILDGVIGGVAVPPASGSSPLPLPSPWLRRLEFCIFSGGIVADLRRLESGFLYFPDIVFNPNYTTSIDHTFLFTNTDTRGERRKWKMGE